jgi:hypothetical protein
MALSRVLDGPVFDWILYEVPCDTEMDRQFLELLSAMKCPDVTDFHTDTKRFSIGFSEARNCDLESIEIATMIGSEADLEWIEIRKSPGEFYRRWIPSDRVSESAQSWLFRNPKDASV